jgi:hypothetical protein
MHRGPSTPPFISRCNTSFGRINSIREKQLTIQNKTSVSYMLSDCKLGSVPTKSVLGSGEVFSPSALGGCGGTSLLSKLNLFERSWKSALRFSVISSNAARCALTNVKVIGAGEPTVDTPFSDGNSVGVKERRMAVPPLFP